MTTPRRDPHYGGRGAASSRVLRARVSSLAGMFSHPAAPIPPQQPQDSKVAGTPALDADWAAAATRWEPEIRPASAAQWSWLRWAWEQLDGSLPSSAAPAASAAEGSEAAAQRDAAVLDASLALLTAFLQAADGDAEVLSGAEAEAPDGSTLRGAPRAAAVAGELAARCGTTLCFAQLWSLARPEELQEDPWAELAGVSASGDQEALDVPGEEARRRPLFPLDSDDIAWIVSGSMTAAKDSTWRWFSGLAAGSGQG